MFKLKEQIQTVKEIPSQIRTVLTLAIGALFLALVAMTVTIVGASRAN